MLTPDVISLKQYYASPGGEVARKLIGDAVARLWPDANGDTMLGLGYTVPLLEPYLQHSQQIIVGMSGEQGAVYWPPARANLVFMAHESELPLRENTMNRVLLLHSLENTEQLTALMEELWRVLTPGGRLLAIVPNRLGFWSRSSKTPFGYGRPFSMMQLRDLMVRNQFTTLRTASALFAPPTRWQWLHRLAPRFEVLGRTLCPFLGGVLIIEAEKQLYAAIKQPALAKRAYRARAASPKPAMSSQRD
ncbi:MAG: class I SAM-dependent methyltransferase [Rickettsiales bacterium]|nr:class I SAM-dependent methyltransferase [Rickettsiales bacterium]